MKRPWRSQSALWCWWLVGTCNWTSTVVGTSTSRKPSEGRPEQKVQKFRRLYSRSSRLRGQEEYETTRGRRRNKKEEQTTKYVYDEIYNEPDIKIVRFPIPVSGETNEQKEEEIDEKDPKNQQKQPKEEKESYPSCTPMTIDFDKASDGRVLTGGTYVENEWSHGYGIKIESYSHDGKKGIHPMIFDSTVIESNGVRTNDIYFLGSPNFECGGFGVGRGGREGQLGENCESLGNLLIPFSNKAGKKKKGNSADSKVTEGGVLAFDFKRYTEIWRIGLLNVNVGSYVKVLHSDGSSETKNVTSVGTNGYQLIDLDMKDVEELNVSFSFLAGIARLDMCIETDQD